MLPKEVTKIINVSTNKFGIELELYEFENFQETLFSQMFSFMGTAIDLFERTSVSISFIRIVMEVIYHRPIYLIQQNFVEDGGCEREDVQKSSIDADCTFLSRVRNRYHVCCIARH